MRLRVIDQVPVKPLHKVHCKLQGPSTPSPTVGWGRLAGRPGEMIITQKSSAHTLGAGGS